MSLSYKQMKELEREVRASLLGMTCLFVKALIPRTFMIGFSKKEKRKSLLLCFQENFLRFHLFNGPFKKENSEWAKKLESVLYGTTLTEILLENSDRILSLTCQKGEKIISLKAEFFSRKPNLYLLDEQQKIIDSLNPSQHGEIYVFPPKPQQNNEKRDSELIFSSFDIQKLYETKAKQALFLAKKNQILHQLNMEIKRTQRQLRQRNEEFHACLEWESIHHEGELLQANLYQLKKGQTQLTVMDWEAQNSEKTLILNPEDPPFQAVARLFRKSKKLKLGLEYAKQQIVLLTEKEKKYSQLMGNLQNIHQEEELNCFCEEENLNKKSTPSKPFPSPFREYLTAAGLKIWVGKNGLKNEQLTFRFAKGSDFWLHVMGYPGAHVVLRGDKGKDPDPDSIKDAIQLALRYSKANKAGEAEICFTQCKFITKLKSGVPGKVQISKHKVLRGRLDETRWIKLKNRMNN